MTIDDRLLTRLAELLPKPLDTATREEKQYFSQRVSDTTALVLAEALRSRGLTGTYPVDRNDGRSGVERRLAGGIGAKRVDVTWSTEESGLLAAVSIKSINFRDGRSGNFQKNLTNRRNDLLYESVTLHRRFPYAVLGGFLILDAGAATDQTGRRKSTLDNARYHLRLFRGRRDPAGRDEQYEEIFVSLFGSDPASPSLTTFGGPELSSEISIDDAITSLLERLVERNSDFYEVVDGRLIRR
jgi:hypothetical protein